MALAKLKRSITLTQYSGTYSVKQVRNTTEFDIGQVLTKARVAELITRGIEVVVVEK